MKERTSSLLSRLDISITDSPFYYNNIVERKNKERGIGLGENSSEDVCCTFRTAIYTYRGGPLKTAWVETEDALDHIKFILENKGDGLGVLWRGSEAC